MKSRSVVTSVSGLVLALAASMPGLAANPPLVGQRAPEFALSTMEGKLVKLSEVNAQGPVVLIVLRGYPGYQCPFCNRQARDIMQQSQAFTQRGAHVVMVYPGAAQDLGAHAKEFLMDKKLTGSIEMLLDPDYKFTNLYGLRWDAPGETAYPSTFLIDKQGTIFFSKMVRAHGGRTTAAEILEVLPTPKSTP